MKNVWAGISLGFLLAGGTALAAGGSYGILSGEWQGTITANQKDTAVAGNVTQDTASTPASLTITKADQGFTGVNRIGDSVESFRFYGDYYSWRDKDITVVTKKMGIADLPEWVKKQAGITPTTSDFFAFKYQKCSVNETKAACESGKHLPAAIIDSGMWLFKVDGTQLLHSVYYTYPSGNKRILEMTMSKK